MPKPLITTLAKLTRPRLHAPVKRTRLFKLLDQGKHQPITWVSGPPGSGKTTLIASYLEARKLKTFWYQVDEGDRDPATFFFYLGELARTATGRRTAQLAALTPDHLLDLPSFARRFFRDLFSRLPAGAILVLDNCQDAAQTAFDSLLRIAAEQVPQSLRLICISRMAPNEEFARLELSARMQRIAWDELQLTLDETRQLAASRTDLATEAERLQELSGGWAAGVVLLLSGSKVGRIPTELAAKLNPQEALFRYFAGEVLAQTELQERELLMRCALLPQIGVQTAEQLSGNHQAAKVLNRLYQMQYFIDRKVETEVTYQFHDLFRDFLLQALRESRDLTEYRQLQRDAANLLEAAGQYAAAVELYHATEDWSQVARLILIQAQEMIDQGRWRTLRTWFAGMPETTLGTDPWLAYWRAAANIPLDPSGVMQLLESAQSRFSATDDTRGQILIACSAIEVTFYIADTFHPFDRWIDVLARLLDNPALQLEAQLERRAWSAFLIAALLRRPGHHLIVVARDKVAPIVFDEALGTTQRVSAATALLEYCHFTCDLKLGTSVHVRLSQLLQDEHVAPMARTWGSIWCGVWFYFNAEFDEALPLLRRSVEIAHGYSIRTLETVSRSLYLLVCYLAGNLDEAKRAIEPLREMVDPSKHYPMAWYSSALGVFHVINQDWQANARSNVDELHYWDATGFVLGQAVLRVAQASIALGFGRPDDAEVALRLVHGHYDDTVGSYLDAIIAALEWKLLSVRGNVTGARARLIEAFAAAHNPKIAVGLRHWTFGLLPEILHAALREEEIDSGLVRSLISRFKVQPLSRAEADWPWPIRIQSLDTLRIEVNGTLRTGKRKAQHRVLDVLKFLIANGGTSVNANAVAEALWSDADGDMAAGNLRTAVLRLRKLLGDEASIQWLDNKLNLNPSLCWLDLWAFESESEPALTNMTLSPTEARRLEQAVRLYSGELLRDHDQAWILVGRERLRARFHQTVLRLAQYWIDNRDGERAERLYQHSLEKDPHAEVFYRQLMLHLHNQGRLTEAAETFRRCERTLHAAGVKPSPATCAVFDTLGA